MRLNCAGRGVSEGLRRGRVGCTAAAEGGFEGGDAAEEG